MRTTRVVCTLAQTINTGNYSSFRIEWTEEAEVLEGEDIDEIRTLLAKRVRFCLLEEKRKGPV